MIKGRGISISSRITNRMAGGSLAAPRLAWIVPFLSPGPSRHLAAALQGAAQGELVGKFQPAAGRQTMCDAGNFQSLSCQSFGQVKAGGIAFHVGSQGDNE